MSPSVGSRSFLSSSSSSYNLRAPVRTACFVCVLGGLIKRSPGVWCAEFAHFCMPMWQQLTAVRADGSERAVTVR